MLHGQFRVPLEHLALEATLRDVPDSRIEMVRVTMTDQLMTPHFWAYAPDLEELHAALLADDSVRDVERIGVFDEATIYRATYTSAVDREAEVYAANGGTVVRTVGTSEGWTLHVQFPTHGDLRYFFEMLAENDVSFSTQSLTSVDTAPRGLEFGLTEKQAEALALAWELGYFRTPRESHLDDVAAALGISKQAVSERLRRAEQILVRNTVLADRKVD
jgi:hypothetical protein